MSGLTLRRADFETVTRHAAEAYPEECCGVLVGRPNGQGAVVEKVISAANERLDSRHNRYVISPAAVPSLAPSIAKLTLICWPS